MQTFTDKTVNSSTTTQPFLLVSNVAKEYPSPEGVYTVLDGVELQVNEGEFVCIIGHSGCGKSTLLNMVAGFSSPSRGQVLLQDKEVKEPGPDRMMVFQNYSLLPWKTAFENVYRG
jgi:nitrate/nitrite transport system ATP-binding protein